MNPVDASPDTHYCPRCGAQLTGQVDTCPSCGQALCPTCGAQVDEDATRCPSCGAAFEFVCPDCGAMLQSSDTRCSRCGAVFVNPSPPPAIPKLTPPPSREQVNQDGYRYGAQQMQAGITGTALETRLSEKGFDSATAAVMVHNLDAAHATAQRQQGRREIVSGILALVGGGLMFTVFSSFALQRSAVTLLDIVFGGLIIVGAIQTGRGLRHYTQGRTSAETIPQAVSNVPVPDAAALWPSRLQNHQLLAGLLILPLACVLAYVLTTVTEAQVEATLIRRPVAELNLRTGDLPAGFQLLEDSRPQEALDRNTTDVSRRTFLQDNHGIVSVITSGSQPIKGDIQETMPAIISQAWPHLTLGAMTDIKIGDQALLCEITLNTQDSVRAGYLLVFFKQNILVFLIEADLPGSLQPETMLAHARIIESRLH